MPCERTDSLRTMAFAVIGLTRPPVQALSPQLLETACDTSAIGCWTSTPAIATPDWRWFEDQLTYDNARLPQALIAAGHRLGNARC